MVHEIRVSSRRERSARRNLVEVKAIFSDNVWNTKWGWVGKVKGVNGSI